MIELQKCLTDPVYFIETCVKIEHPILGPIPFKLHPFQQNYINEIHSGSVIAAFGRQMGKTTLTAAYLLWASIFKFDHSSLIIGKNLSQATEVLSRIKFMFEGLPSWMKPSVRYMSQHTLSLNNGSCIRIAAANSRASRGLSLNTVVFEEFAFWSAAQQEEVVASVLPCLLATTGKLIISSTIATTDIDSKNEFNVIYKNALNGKSKLKALRYSWKDHPEHDEEWAEQMVQMLGQERFNTEFEVNLETV